MVWCIEHFLLMPSHAFVLRAMPFGAYSVGWHPERTDTSTPYSVFEGRAWRLRFTTELHFLLFLSGDIAP